MMNPRQIVSGYFVLQAIGVVAWWALLRLHPQSIGWFYPRSWPDDVLLSFWLADFTLIVGGSCIVAFSVWHQRNWASTAAWSVAAICWYPTLVCIATSMRTGEAWIASAMMASMAVLSLAMATIQGKQGDAPAAFRVTSMNRLGSLLSTLGQIVIFWGTFLWILPMGIVELQETITWNRFEHSFQTQASIGLFLLASCLGLWSGLSMVTLGGGTPLPTATAPRLVIAGPYRFVRNPMAVAGILQGIAVGWLLGSVPVIIYALTGIVAWHVFVRPVEEQDLLERFGSDYERYRSRVRVWVPTIGWTGQQEFEGSEFPDAKNDAKQRESV
ncbi:isoprenylcysteine carboxylmethyltransferase family protein [Roseiconus lacunae]|uniref:methyltransferase family protein n=1 Tax=Roseiconus lacunae TaxID=2605694 RepID=UPI00308C9395|nr:isoprenylcysteine carboxylmethyltransferase family protein [Stieleria sp. HD01]